MTKVLKGRSCRARPELCYPGAACNQTTQPHPSQVPAWDSTSRATEMQRHGEPCARNHCISPPPLIKLRVLIILILSNRLALTLHPCPYRPPSALKLPLPREAQEITRHTTQPGAIRPQIHACGL